MSRTWELFALTPFQNQNFQILLPPTFALLFIICVIWAKIHDMRWYYGHFISSALQGKTTKQIQNNTLFWFGATLWGMLIKCSCKLWVHFLGTSWNTYVLTYVVLNFEIGLCGYMFFDNDTVNIKYIIWTCDPLSLLNGKHKSNSSTCALVPLMVTLG
jgi:hypothetical protein